MAVGIGDGVCVGVGAGDGVCVAVGIGDGVCVGVCVGVGLGEGVAVGVGVLVGVGVCVGVGVAVAAGLMVTVWRAVARLAVLPYRRNCAVKRTLPARQPWRSRSQLCDETRRNSYKVLLDVEQLDHTLALRLLALSLTVYERDTSKLDALTVNSSLRPALMEDDKSDIDTLGRGRTRMVLVPVARLSEPSRRRRFAVTVTLPARQA